MKSTVDFVVRSLTIIVATVVIVEVVGMVVLALIHPDTNVSPVFDALTETVTVIVGALIGFISGRHVGRNESDRSP